MVGHPVSFLCSLSRKSLQQINFKYCCDPASPFCSEIPGTQTKKHPSSTQIYLSLPAWDDGKTKLKRLPARPRERLQPSPSQQGTMSCPMSRMTPSSAQCLCGATQRETEHGQALHHHLPHTACPLPSPSQAFHSLHREGGPFSPRLGR